MEAGISSRLFDKECQPNSFNIGYIAVTLSVLLYLLLTNLAAVVLKINEEYEKNMLYWKTKIENIL